ncbi:hypothetical protein DFH06DRAFT_1471788 [Mycena polygramma]|nr:hypothetical protein DFH06DRAFT_1471788 [Mycena polygramma]
MFGIHSAALMMLETRTLWSRLKAVVLTWLRRPVVSRKRQPRHQPVERSARSSLLDTASPIGIYGLPQELIDIIIHENSTDLTTLLSCALVCRAFLWPSQACIFSEVGLSSQARADHFHGFLVDSPHLRRYVRTLDIFEASTGRDVTGFWLAGCPSIILSLGLLDAVTSFTLMFQHSGSMGNWDNLPQEMREAICALCKRSPLVCLRLSCLGNVTDRAEFSQLVNSTLLRKMFLAYIDLPYLRENEPAPLVEHLRLTQLALRLRSPTMDALTRRLLDGNSLRHVRFLDVNWDFKTSSQVAKILKVGTSIRELFWGVNNGRVCDVPRGFTINSLCNLTKLRLLHVSVWLGGADSEIGCNLLAGLLKGGPKGLRALEVVVHMIPSPVVPTIDWVSVGSVLNAKDFPVLGDVVINLVFPCLDDIDQRHLQNIHYGFARLHEEKILKCAVVSPLELVFPSLTL